MAISVNWGTRVINVPKADLALVQAGPPEVRELDLDWLRLALKDIGRVFIVAIVLDTAYQLIVYRWVYPGQVLLVAVVCAIVPYVLVRGPITRTVRLLLRKRAESRHGA